MFQNWLAVQAVGSMAFADGSISINVASANGLSMDKHALVMDANNRWPFPAHLDGWVLSHNALRRDMCDILSALKVLLRQVEAGTPLASWQVSAVIKYWQHFTEAMKSHHDNEEAVFFPWVETRERLPLLWSEEHGILIELLTECDEAMGALRVTHNAEQDMHLLETFMGPYAPFKHETEEHFLHEEECLPLIRQKFTSEEAKRVHAAMRKHLAPTEVAGFYHAMSDGDRREFFRVNHIPKRVQLLGIMPAVKKFDREVHKPLRAVISSDKRGGKHISMGCFGA